MSKHTLHCCPICAEPIEITGMYLNVERKYVEKHGFKIEVGGSRGGWGHFECRIQFSEEICDACDRALEEMLRPAIEFIRHHPRRKGDPVSTMRGSEPSPAGRGASLLRLLSSFHSVK